MNKTKNNAFTLVELIVVIVILAILGTIAFISLQWYSSEARNTKRKSDLSNIISAIELKMIEWVKTLSFVEWSWAIILGNETSWKIQIAWRIWYNESLSWSYNAGNINYTPLWIKAENFSDPITQLPYKIWVTTFNNQYNLWATIEVDWIPDTYIKWNWNPRTTNETKVSWKSSENIFYLSWTTVENILLRKWDTVKISTWTWYIIERLEKDKIYLNRTLEAWDQLASGNIMLFADETKYLIAKRKAPFVVKIWEWEEYTPYKITY